MTSRLLLILVYAVIQTNCHCPHMMGMQMKKEKVDGPSAPGSLPDGDKGWDFDDNGAPGSVPKEYYIQTTFIHRSEDKQQKDFAEMVQRLIGELRNRLRAQARVTIDNEVVS
ncbi:unnamed protein product [Nippostrongylus brasiliensis]|uniref:Secreted protein n=1 Tax=Nippostrongylus brasiliensis TaxID=27835 RepID=A0A0N4XDU1_NIPBR|nr:unnamed protein product [Nippostrongylus brasiliensis]